MLRSARFALLVALSGALTTVVALDPPQRPDQNKQSTKVEKKKADKVEPAKKEAPAAGAAEERIDRRNARMKERNREIDGLVNKKK
jgi:hypothetical protein